MSFNLLSYFDKRIPSEVLDYAKEINCPSDCIVAFKPAAGSATYYALADLDSDNDWLEVVRLNDRGVTVAYAYPKKTASQCIALISRYQTAMELPFVPVIPAELPLLFNFGFHNQRLNKIIVSHACRLDPSVNDYSDVIVPYLCELDEFDLSECYLNEKGGFHKFKIVVRKEKEPNKYIIYYVIDPLAKNISDHYFAIIDANAETLMRSIWNFCINYGKACLEDDVHFVKNIEDFIRQKRPFHDILNYFNK